MMGPAHSLSGAAAWTGVGVGAALAHHPMPWPVLLGGALICAGAALAPDLDHPAATISRAFGPISRAMCHGIDKLSAVVYNATRVKANERKRDGGHRGITHTWAWAVLLGAFFAAVGVLGGYWGVLAILFIHMVLAVEGLFWRAARVSSDILVWLLGAAVAWGLAGQLKLPGGGSHWLFDAPNEQYLWLGLPIVLGSLVHCFGDAITVSGCPILWPVPIAGKRWYPLGTPKAIRFHAGAKVETKVLMPIFMIVGGGCAVASLVLGAVI